MENFESFTIYPMPRKRYAEVKAVLIERGYRFSYKEWDDDEDCVTTTDEGAFMTCEFLRVQGLEEPVYTVDEFLAKFKPVHQETLTPDEVKQLRELLKSFSPKPEPQPEPKLEIYSGVFSFDGDGANCNYGKQRLYWFRYDSRWGVIDSAKTEPHNLIEEPHEIGQFYLLGQTLDRENPKNYGLYDGKKFWRWNSDNEVVSIKSATNLKAVIA